MSLSRATITFNTDMESFNTVGFTIVDRNTGQEVLSFPDFTWFNARNSAFQIPINTLGKLGRNAAQDLRRYVNLDAGGDYRFTITVAGSSTTLTMINPNYDFAEVYSRINTFTKEDNPLVEINIQNYIPETYKVSSYEFLEAVDNSRCSHFRTRIVTTEDTLSIDIGQNVITGNFGTTFDVETPRGSALRVLVKNEISSSSNTTNSESLIVFANLTPSFLNASNINISVFGSPLGGTATIDLEANEVNNLKYSLDNVNFQPNNVFSTLEDGEYTAYIKDDFGCTVSKDFIVLESNILDPYFYLSKAMSFRFSKIEDFKSCGPYPIDENTLSHDIFRYKNDLIAYCEHQQFNSCDVITTQFKSNYKDVSVKVLEGNTETDIQVDKKTRFIGIKDSRDAIIYDAGGNQAGVYFTSGNIYDYDTDVDTGEDYTLNGGLPEWGSQIGNFLNIGSAWFEIINVIYDEDLDSEVILINSVYSRSPEAIIVKTIFNRQKYEVYEFDLDLSEFEDKNLQIKITSTDENFEELVYLSEIIDVKKEHSETLEIVYYNSSNDDVYYKTGIKNKIRIPIAYIRGDHEDDSENLKGDNSSSLILSNVYELDEFEFLPVTKEIYRKIVQALSHESVFLDKVSYIKSSSIDKEGPLEDTNLYVVTAVMLKTNKAYSSNVIGEDPEIINEEEVLEVPNIVIRNNGKIISYRQ